MNKKVLVAVAWPYVNGDLHVGHLAGYLIPADIVARFNRLVGNDVLMVSGSDCHGTPITVESDKTGKSPAEIVDFYHARDVALFKKYNLSYNLYTKTTSEVHKQVVQKLFLDLLQNGFILKKKEKQYYSESDKKFLPDRYVEGECPHCHALEQRSDQCEVCGRMLEAGTLINPYSKLSKSNVVLKETEHYYLDLSKLSEDLEDYVDSKVNIWRKWIYKEAKGWIKEGLRPRAITRDLDWGIELPVDDIPEHMKLDTFEGKRLYVWFEAVTGYLSAPQEWLTRNGNEEDIIYNKFEGQSESWEDWWFGDGSTHYYFLGQDNVVFHTLLWPGQLMGAGNYNLPDVVSANKFMNYEGKKFSKSRNWIIDSNEIADKFGIAAVRYYISANLPENKEGNFVWDAFYEANNNELVANLGNFINRTLVFIEKYCDGKIVGSEESIDSQVLAKIEEAFKKTEELLVTSNIVDALGAVMELSAFGNKYFNDSEVWNVIKKDKVAAEKILVNLYQIVQSLSILIEPFLPNSSAKLRKDLGLEEIIPAVGKDYWKYSFVGEITLNSKIQPLFAKIDIKKAKEKQGKPGKEEVRKLLEQVKLVKVVLKEKHPNADKLLIVEVTDNKDTYRIVTGADNFEVGDVVAYLGVGEVVPGPLIEKGKEFRLEEKDLRGVVSSGMILAEDEIGIGKDHSGIVVFEPQEDLVGKSILEVLTEEQLRRLSLVD